MKLFLLLSLSAVSLYGHGVHDLLESLNPDQRSLLQKDFESPERTQWHYVPMKERKGLKVSAMTKDQHAKMMQVLNFVFSEQGVKKLLAVIEMEKVLKEYEGRHRDPGKYYFTLFGQVGQAKWGFSFEGHHLSLNFTFEGDKLISGTPMFFGANPATILKNKSSQLREGERPMALEEDLAFELVKSFDAEQQKLGLNPRASQRDLKGAKQAKPGQYEDFGIQWSQLKSAQQALLLKLIKQGYVDNYRGKYAEDAWKKILAQKESLHFSFYGEASLKKPHYYRIIGKSTVIVLFNTQNGTQKTPVNHVHLLWRDRDTDFIK